MATQDASPGTRTIAVVTVSYASEGVLPGFLASISAASADELVVIVADNKPSAVGAVEQMSIGAGASYLPLDENRGYGGAVNAAVGTLGPEIEWVLVSNPDIELHPGSIDVLVSAASELDIASVGPAIFTDGRLYPSAREIPSLRTGVGHALFANLWLSNPWTRSYRNDRADDAVRRDTGWLSGACLLVRRSAFEQVGGFDEGYFMYFEDVDLGYRLGRAGFRNIYEPSAKVIHAGAHSTRTETGTMLAAHHASARRFIDTKYRGPLLWPVRAALGIGLAIRSRMVSRKAR